MERAAYRYRIMQRQPIVLHLYHRRGDDTGRFDTDGQNYKRLAALEADVERYTPIIGYSECHG